MFLFAALLLFVFLVGYMLSRHPQFGKSATGARLQRMQSSAQYRNGAFQNMSETPSLTDGATILSVLGDFIFKRHPRVKPAAPIPIVQTNVSSIPLTENILVWFGHSSYYMQVDGKRVLVDPVLGSSASPVSFTTKAFAGAAAYRPGDMPAIDYLFITHDHYDHLDYETIMELQPRVGKVICGLGTGAHLEHWGFNPANIIELDWQEEVELGEGLKVHCVPARHFSGRNFKRNATLWSSFALLTPTLRIFIGGDSGYDTHFKQAGQSFGPFDLAILENGQYNASWKYIHMMPEEVVQAAIDLRADSLLPVHSGKFALANHAWDEPLVRIAAAATTAGVRLVTPMIGEPLRIKDRAQTFSAWWKD